MQNLRPGDFAEISFPEMEDINTLTLTSRWQCHIIHHIYIFIETPKMNLTCSLRSESGHYPMQISTLVQNQCIWLGHYQECFECLRTQPPYQQWNIQMIRVEHCLPIEQRFPNYITLSQVIVRGLLKYNLSPTSQLPYVAQSPSPKLVLVERATKSQFTAILQDFQGKERSEVVCHWPASAS